MSIILSIKPKFTDLILNGQKTIEMRTKIGKKFTNEQDVVIYSSSPKKAIVAIAKIKKIENLDKYEVEEHHLKKVCISRDFFNEYMKNRDTCYLIELKDLKKLKSPLILDDLRKKGFIAPQSFCYASSEILDFVTSSL